MSSSESDIEEIKSYKYNILPQSEIKTLQFENLSKNSPKKKRKNDEIDPENNNVKKLNFKKFMTIIPEKKKVKFENDITIYRISPIHFKQSHVYKQITKKDYYRIYKFIVKNSSISTLKICQHLNFKYSESIINDFITEFNLMLQNKVINNINDYLKKKNIIYEFKDIETRNNTIFNKKIEK